ncbi:hypothetical protein SELMODRAFT_425040 [Selaginella moellendorffii]|uniref:RRM domain-containing protein n=1 Tax=Selaginella moellendorffii TaxID=88036 RepID=D8SRU5_SELML|nr:hypothetical protein SELMODRAFT_425040 [Selaginella moellendorffii]
MADFPIICETCPGDNPYVRMVDQESSFGKVRPNDMILKLQRTSPYYKRNRAHVCSFFVRGGCQRGSHTMGKLNDPVAAKLLKKAEEMSTLTPPDDATVRTLYVGGLDERVTTEDLKDNFYSYGKIESLRLVPQRACAFITYTTREDAEKAAEDLSFKHQMLDLDDCKWQEIKPKLGAAWPSARTGFQLAVYLDELKIFLYGGYFKEPASDKDQSDKGEKNAVIRCTECIRLLPCGRINAGMVSGKDTSFLYGCMKEVGEKEVTLNNLFSLDLNKLNAWRCIIKETQNEWIKASEEDGEIDNDNSDAGSISKGTDKEDDGKPGETLRDFFSRTIMYWQMARYNHTEHTRKELRKDGFELAKTCYRELKPILDKLTRLEADHNAEEEATKPSKERSKKRR